MEPDNFSFYPIEENACTNTIRIDSVDDKQWQKSYVKQVILSKDTAQRKKKC